MKTKTLKHLLSGLIVFFFLFAAFGSDESTTDTNESVNEEVKEVEDNKASDNIDEEGQPELTIDIDSSEEMEEQSEEEIVINISSDDEME